MRENPIVANNRSYKEYFEITLPVSQPSDDLSRLKCSQYYSVLCSFEGIGAWVLIFERPKMRLRGGGAGHDITNFIEDLFLFFKFTNILFSFMLMESGTESIIKVKQSIKYLTKCEKRGEHFLCQICILLDLHYQRIIHNSIQHFG